MDWDVNHVPVIHKFTKDLKIHDRPIKKVPAVAQDVAQLCVFRIHGCAIFTMILQGLYNESIAQNLGPLGEGSSLQMHEMRA